MGQVTSQGAGKGFGNLIQSATSFVDDKVGSAKNLANNITQQATPFFNAMGQVTSQGAGLSKSTESNLRENLLNKTIKKIYEPLRPPDTKDLQSQLKDFLGGSLGDRLL